MAPKKTGPEREALRARVWAAHTQGTGLGAIATAERIAKSTVQSMIRQIKASGQIAPRTSTGRPPKVTKRCDLHTFWLTFRCCLCPFRYKNALYRLALQKPFWGSKRLGDELHAQMVSALTNRPPGAVVQVFYHSTALLTCLCMFLDPL